MTAITSSRFPVIDLSRLAPLTVIDIPSSESIIAARMAKLKEIWTANDPPFGANYDVEGLEFDPLKINQELNAYFQTLLMDRINQSARATTLAFSSGTDIDAIASRYPGGVPRLDGESDVRYRRRVWLAANALTTAGAAEAYVFHALSAVPSLSDATAIGIRPTKDDPQVVVTCLSERAEMVPSAAELDAVRARLDRRDVRPLTDVVVVQGAHLVRTDYRLRVVIYPGPDAGLMQTQVAAAIDAFIAQQRVLGGDHMRSAIFDAAVIPGVYDVKIDSPAADIRVDATTAVKVDGIDIRVTGRDE